MARPSNVSRRQFLVQSASIAGASLGLRAAQSCQAGGAEPLRLGIVGAGDRGRQLLTTALGLATAEVPVRIAAICDVHPQHLKKALDLAAASSPRGFTDFASLLSAPGIDAVVIATPVHCHHSQTLAALAAGKHVYCEKPMARTAAECREVLAACATAESRGQLYQSGFQRRYNLRYQKSIEFLRSGEAGDVRFVRAQWHAVGSARKDKPWLYHRDRSGDIVLEQACHQFDVFNWVFAGPPIRVQAAGGMHASDGPPGRDTLDHYGAILEYGGGGKVLLSHLTYSIPDRRFAGIYELAFCERAGVDLASAVVWDGAGRSREICSEKCNDTQQALMSFADSVRRQRRPVADARSAYDACITALSCARAIAGGGSVSPADLV